MNLFRLLRDSDDDAIICGQRWAYIAVMVGMFFMGLSLGLVLGGRS